MPQEGEVLLKVAYAGVNPIDVKTRAGLGWAAQHNKTTYLGLLAMMFQGCG